MIDEMHLTPLLERPLDIDQDTEVESTEAESNEPVMVEVNGQMVVVAGREDSMDTGANSGTSGGGGSGKLGAGGIVQLRPCFDHLDQEAKEAEELKRKAKLEQYLHKKKEEESGGSAQTGDGSLSVQFKKRESAYVKQAKKQSHASMVQRASEEPWIECKYYSSQVRTTHTQAGRQGSTQASWCTAIESSVVHCTNSERSPLSKTSEAAEVFDKLFCLSEGVIDLNVRSSDDYLKLLHPAPKKKDKDLPVTMPEKEYVRRLLGYYIHTPLVNASLAPYVYLHVTQSISQLVSCEPNSTFCGAAGGFNVAQWYGFEIERVQESLSLHS